ncbi:hypothetical protein BWI93_00985 [Siphonobacter sp. BAB-5385]|uniref:hypothetical protein n=1 Tax=Siphonobacter sp. BAB-5385 TaxID=1864822 RepID=UPI000B9E7785|nr:hypothetical protein [Siphonobacter sp. BAB-5385]OZI09945.1 hypothetical protein BWI93_00985 [Siphonobacter sp. BAB-5385]
MLNDVIFVSLVVVGVLFVSGKWEISEWAYHQTGWQVFRCLYCQSFWLNCLILLFVIPPLLILPGALAGAAFGTPFLMILKRGL